MTNGQSNPDGTLSDDELAWLRARARGEFGVIQTCATHVTRDGQGWAGELGVFDDAHIPGWTRLVRAMHAEGALVIAQLFHGGARADRTLTGETPLSATASTKGPEIRAATESDLARIVDAFRRAAQRVHEAGGDGVELHGAHGYLLCQFLSSAFNRRTDGWGGDLVGRARLIRETMRAVRAGVPRPFSVGVRLSPEDYGGFRGLDLDESLQIAAWLAEDGADFIHISLWDVSQRTTKRPQEHAVTLFRSALPDNVKLIVAGAIWTQEKANEMLALGADAVALGRAAIANPDWPAQMQRSALWEPRRPPLSAGELRERALSDTFVDYMRRWPGFVEDQSL